MRISNETLDQGFAKLESGLNSIGYIPVVSTISGAGRFCYGKYQLIAAIACGVFIAFSSCVAADKSRRLGEAVDIVWEYGVHGVGNMIRGSVEILPLVNLLCIAYDRTGMRMNYRFEHLSLGMRPIFQY